MVALAEAPVDAATWQKAAALLGLGLRGRRVVVGVEQVRAAAGKGDVVLALVADDASPNSRKKVEGLLRAKRIPVMGGMSAAALGEAVGREATAAVGVLDGGLASGITKHLTSRVSVDEESGG